jgi:hypothetical protein
MQTSELWVMHFNEKKMLCGRKQVNVSLFFLIYFNRRRAIFLITSMV